MGYEYHFAHVLLRQIGLVLQQMRVSLAGYLSGSLNSGVRSAVLPFIRFPGSITIQRIRQDKPPDGNRIPTGGFFDCTASPHFAVRRHSFESFSFSTAVASCGFAAPLVRFMI